MLLYPDVVLTLVGLNMKSTFHSVGKAERVVNRLPLDKASCSGCEKRVVQARFFGIIDFGCNVGLLTFAFSLIDRFLMYPG